MFNLFVNAFADRLFGAMPVTTWNAYVIASVCYEIASYINGST